MQANSAMTKLGQTVGDKMLARMFQRVNDVVWDISTGKMGILGKNGSIFSLVGEGEDAQVVENMFSEFGMAVPAFAQSVPFDSVQLGDLAFRPGGRPGWVVEKNPNSLILLNTDSSEGTLRRNKVVTMGMDQSGVMVLRNLFNMTGGAGQESFQMLMPMLMAGTTNEDAGGMVQMMLMMSAMNPSAGQVVDASGSMASAEIPPQPKLVQEDIPADATKATIVEITKRNNEALVAYQAAIDAWAKIVATLSATKPVAPAAVNPMQMMMPMMLAQAMSQKGGKSFFDN